MTSPRRQPGPVKPNLLLVFCGLVAGGALNYALFEGALYWVGLVCLAVLFGMALRAIGQRRVAKMRDQ
jgi:hypothetical protein